LTLPLVQVVTKKLVQSLGECILAGTLDVLYHSQTYPITSPAKVRYLGAFLYGGYLLLVKAKRSNSYEVRHYLPLEVFDMIDVTEGELTLNQESGMSGR
jgi:hypothetical protein